MIAGLYIVAVCLSLAGLTLGALALFADRSRGRRRCPKCSHPVDPAIGMRCPECGREARNERQLFRTRRRWKLAIAAVVVFGGIGLALAGLARVQQTGGWKDLPGWAAARLMWIRDDKLDADLQRRVTFGLLTRAEVLEIVREARRRVASNDLASIDSGLELLNKIARNSYGYDPDPVAIARPTLEELEPERLYDALMDLLARHPTYQRKGYELLGHIKDADVRAALTLIDGMRDPNAGYPRDACRALLMAYRPSQSGRVRRLPVGPYIALDFEHRQHRRNAPPPLPIATAFGKNVAGFRGDVNAIKAWARSRWVESRADQTQPDVERLPELWMWCRLDDFAAESWPAVRNATSDGDPLVEEYGVYLLSAYPWTPEMEDLLRNALRSPHAEVQSEAVSTATRFGKKAQPLTPIIVEQAASVEGARGSSGLVDDFRTMGGRDEDLRDAIVRRLELIHDKHFNQLAMDQRPTSPAQTLHVEDDFWFLADIGLKDERAAAICRKFIGVGKISPSLQAAMAYAATSGERAEATRFIVDHDPDLTQTMFVFSAQQTFLDLVRRGLADPQVVMDYYAEADSTQKGAFAGMLRSYIWKPDILGQYMPLLNEMASDESDPAAQSEAAATIAKYEKNRDLSKKGGG